MTHQQNQPDEKYRMSTAGVVDAFGTSQAFQDKVVNVKNYHEFAPKYKVMYRPPCLQVMTAWCMSLMQWLFYRAMFLTVPDYGVFVSSQLFFMLLNYLKGPFRMSELYNLYLYPAVYGTAQLDRVEKYHPSHRHPDYPTNVAREGMRVSRSQERDKHRRASLVKVASTKGTGMSIDTATNPPERLGGGSGGDIELFELHKRTKEEKEEKRENEKGSTVSLGGSLSLRTSGSMGPLQLEKLQQLLKSKDEPKVKALLKEQRYSLEVIRLQRDSKTFLEQRHSGKGSVSLSVEKRRSLHNTLTTLTGEGDDKDDKPAETAAAPILLSDEEFEEWLELMEGPSALQFLDTAAR